MDLFYEIFLRFSASIFFLDFEPCGNIVSAQRVQSKAIIGGVESVPNLML